MRLWVAAMVLPALVSCAGAAAAGVIFQQEQLVTRRSGSWKTERTILVEGGKAKVVGKDDTVVVDFEQPRTLMIHPRQKSYYQTPFPPPEMLTFVVTSAIVPPMVDYRKTGKHKTILGYQCDEYSGSKQFPTVSYYDVVCFSPQAPGAKDYDTFVRGLIAKLDRDRKKPLSKIVLPDGIPLETQATVAIGRSKPAPALSGKPATSGAAKAQPNPPPSSSGQATELLTTTVTSVKAQSISPAEFNPPTGYAKKPAPVLGLGH